MTAPAFSTAEEEFAEVFPRVAPPHISIGILAWNEEEAIGATLQSVFQQTLFARLHDSGLRCEIVCVANGCTDNTPMVAKWHLNEWHSSHPLKETVSVRVVEIEERGKSNAWDQFVHMQSARAARFLFFMDGDILIRHVETLWNMYAALQEHPEATIAVDQPLKDISLKDRKTFRDQLSLDTTRMTQSEPAQLTGQLYCMRAEAARRIYLPRDLLVEDGFIKAVVCSDWLTKPALPARIVRARNADHIFQAYTSAGDVLRNQKRQVIGQTITHLLVDKYLTTLPADQRQNLAATLRELEQSDPKWLRRLIGAHLREVRWFWQLFPGLLQFRFKRMTQLKGAERLKHLPAALLGFGVTLISSWNAFRFLKQGYVDYWPDTKSPVLREFQPARQQ